MRSTLLASTLLVLSFGLVGCDSAASKPESAPVAVPVPAGGPAPAEAPKPAEGPGAMTGSAPAEAPKPAAEPK